MSTRKGEKNTKLQLLKNSTKYECKTCQKEERDRQRARVSRLSFQLFEQPSGTKTFCVSRFLFFGAKPTQDAVAISLDASLDIWYAKSRKFQQQEKEEEEEEEKKNLL